MSNVTKDVRNGLEGAASGLVSAMQSSMFASLNYAKMKLKEAEEKEVERHARKEGSGSSYRPR